ncbi:MAG: (d)CMP kinase [Acutalibacteraceae bacterium]|jgi:cytidylate kinase
MSNTIAVAIDGPSGAGKSTIARILARELRFIYVDTGALYRAVGHAVLSRGHDPKDAAAVVAILPQLTVELRYENDSQRVYVNGEDVSDRIRTPEVSMAASAVSALPPVRRFLFDLQQDIAATHNVIMDGRDIGTVVLPHARVKIFLTASAEDRAARRYDELREKGVSTTFDEVLADMIRRDHDDSTRAAAPLKAADDAILVDTSGNTLEQSVALLKEIVTRKLEEKGPKA